MLRHDGKVSWYVGGNCTFCAESRICFSIASSSVIDVNFVSSSFMC